MSDFKLAFTSCASATAYPHSQPVWAQIAAESPDALVLLGDSIYIDVPGQVPLGDHEFAVHVHQLYQRQLAIPEFRALVARVGLRSFAIWDDHDFLWNDVLGKEARRP